MPIRPVSFLAQAAAQRHASRENESQRKFQKEQALRDFGMNVGQSLIASLGNFGAQAGADAIRFNREEPFKMLEQDINPMPDVTEVPSTVGTGAADALSKAAMARTQTPPPATPPPVSEFTPKPVVPKAAPRAMSPALQKTILPQVNAMEPPASDARYESAFDAPGAPPRVASAKPGGSATPAPPSGGFDALEYMRNPSSVVPPKPRPEVPSPAPAQAPAAPPSPMEQAREIARPGETVSVSQSSRGSVAPEVRLRALQDMDRIAQRWTSGVPLRFQKKDGSEVTPREAAFATAYAMNADLKKLEMLKMQGAIEAEEANSLSARIKAQAEGEAATTKAEAYERSKALAGWKDAGASAKSVTQNYDRNGRLLSGAPREFVVTNDPNAPMWPSVESVPDPERPQYGNGKGGGAPRTSLMFPDATEVWAQQYSETRNDRGQNLQEAVVLPEEYLDMADPKIGKFKYINRADAPAIKKALDAGDWQTAQSLFKEANARFAKGGAAATEMVLPPRTLAKDAEGDAAAAAAAAERAERAKVTARAKAVQDAEAARSSVMQKPSMGSLFPGLKPKKAAAAYAATMSGSTIAPDGVPPEAWEAGLQSAKPYLDSVRPRRGKYDAAYKAWIANGGTPEEWEATVPPFPGASTPAPGPSEQSPGQFPPPGDESKVDELFQKIESQPWSAERKKRVFLMRAKEAGLA
jgi:hypothetical protein